MKYNFFLEATDGRTAEFMIKGPTRAGAADLGKNVVLVLQDEAPFSVIFVPVQLHDQRLLVQV